MRTLPRKTDLNPYRIRFRGTFGNRKMCLYYQDKDRAHTHCLGSQPHRKRQEAAFTDLCRPVILKWF